MTEEKNLSNWLKLAILIFAYNEEKTIAQVINDIPKHISGIDEIEILVIDDNSTDQTRNKAIEAGAIIISNKNNKGLAISFTIGIEEALKRKADIIAHTDGDNQYNQKQIVQLIQPILKHKAEAVIGNRQIKKLKFMKKGNKYGNLFGNFVFNHLLCTKDIDFSSGFRAYNKKAAMYLTIFSNHTYTHESIIQIINQKFQIYSIPVDFKAREQGKSKLIKNLLSHIVKSIITIIRTVLYYKPLKTFAYLGSVLFLLGFLIGLRFIYFYFTVGSSGHIQSLILASILLILGFLVIILGLIADIINRNSRINQELLYRIKKDKYQNR